MSRSRYSLAWSVAIFHAFWCTVFLTVFGKTVMTVIHSAINLPLHSPICEEWGEKKWLCHPIWHKCPDLKLQNCYKTSKNLEVVGKFKDKFWLFAKPSAFSKSFPIGILEEFCRFTDKYTDDENFDRRSEWPNHFYSSAYDNNTFLY